MPEVERISTVILPNPDYSVTIGGIEVTPEEMRKEVGREIGKRKTVYPKLIESFKLSRLAAHEQLLKMEANYWLIKAIANGQANPPVSATDLFGDVTVPVLKISGLADQLEAESRAGDASAYGKAEAAKAIRQLIKEVVG